MESYTVNLTVWTYLNNFDRYAPDIAVSFTHNSQLLLLLLFSLLMEISAQGMLYISFMELVCGNKTKTDL